jgi:hypothetical protein
MSLCDCKVRPDGTGIDYCPVHYYAPEMLKALRSIESALDPGKEADWFQLFNAWSHAVVAIALIERREKKSHESL